MDSEVAELAAYRSQAGERTSAAQDPIMVMVDFSEESEAALLWATEHAGRIGAPLEILHVIHDPADAPGRYRPSNGDPLEPIADVARRKLAEFLESVRDRHPEAIGLDDARALCAEGLPASTILHSANRRGAQMLVLGCRRRNGLKRAVFGSTSQEIARKASMPVTIVKADPQ